MICINSIPDVYGFTRATRTKMKEWLRVVCSILCGLWSYPQSETNSVYCASPGEVAERLKALPC